MWHTWSYHLTTRDAYKVLWENLNMADASNEKLESEKICFVDCHAHISANDFSEVKHCIIEAECRASLVHVIHTLYS